MSMSNQDEMDAYISAENAKFRLANLLKGERRSGHAEGLEEGRAETRESVRGIARKMLASGMSKESVKEFTSLSDAEIAAL